MIHYSAERGGFFHAQIHAGALPPDAVKISDKVHQALLAAQATGKHIVAGQGGRPVAINPPPLPAEYLWEHLRRRRNALLCASDWTQLPDVPPALRAAWTPYRQALRDLPAHTRDPAKPAWPTLPGA